MLFNDTTIQLFWAKVDKTGPLFHGTSCWIWTAYRNPNGYGQFRPNGKLVLAHRFSYVLKSGPIPEGLELDHLCRNPPCVNWDHLEAVSHQLNMQRGISGEALAHKNRAKTHCPHGHIYDLFNTYIYKERRHCRTCRVQRTKQWRLDHPFL